MSRNNYSIVKILSKEIVGVFLLMNVTAKVYIPKGRSVSNEITVSGKVITAKTVGNYLMLEKIGSGKYIFEKQL